MHLSKVGQEGMVRGGERSILLVSPDDPPLICAIQSVFLEHAVVVGCESRLCTLVSHEVEEWCGAKPTSQSPVNPSCMACGVVELWTFPCPRGLQGPRAILGAVDNATVMASWKYRHDSRPLPQPSCTRLLHALTTMHDSLPEVTPHPLSCLCRRRAC